MLIRSTSSSVLALAIALAGCAADVATDELETRTDELTATTEGLRVVIRDDATFDARGALVIRGTTDRDIRELRSWVPDDAFGAARLVNRRTFEIALRDGYEINTILSGAPLFLTFETQRGPVHAMLHLAPRFTRFSGSSTLWIDDVIRPVYTRDVENPLRYRGRVTSTRDVASLDVYTAFNPDVSAVDARTLTFDWDFDGFVVSADPRATRAVELRARLADGRVIQKRAQIAIRAVRIELAAGEVPLAWTLSQCDESIYWCIQSGADAADLAGCGDYRDVARCVNVSPEERCSFEGPSPFALTAFDASDELDPSVAEYDRTCPRGGTFCSMGGVRAFTLPSCLAEPATLARVLEALEGEQDFIAGGTVYDRAGLESTSLFAAPGGPGLLLALDVTSGGGDVQGYIASEEFACHNCTNFAEYAVLFYPGSNTVFVVQRTYGWDS